MRAYVMRQAGAPLTVEELATPEPRHGEVLVKVAANGVCHSDLHVMSGHIAFPTPGVLGHEMSGTVVEVGPGVDNVRPGDRVVSAFIMPCGACEPCWRGEEDLCEKFFALNRLKGHLYDDDTRLFGIDGEPIAMYSMGGLAELSVVPATDVFVVPDCLPLADAAVLGCAVFTAYGALRHTGDLRFGDTVAVIGTGGVGSAIIQVARAMGAGRVIAVDIDDAKLAAAAQMGATDTVNSRIQDPVAAVRRISGGRGAMSAYEAVGHGETIAQAAGMVREGGKAVLVGLARAGATTELEITPLVRRKVQILGSFGARPRTDMPVIIDMAARGLIDVSGSISKRFAFGQVNEAYRALADGAIIGRAIVDMSL